MNGYKTDPTEELFADWRKDVRDARLNYETEAKKLDERLNSIMEELNRLRDEEALIEQAIRAYKARRQQPSKRSPLQGNSLRETLIIHFFDTNGVIKGIEASKALVDIGYFPDRSSADSAIYTALAKPLFKKLDKGVYAIPTDSPEWKRLRGTNGKSNDFPGRVQSNQKQHQKSELMDRVEHILAEHPDWDVNQVRKELQRQHWDFKGKHPNLVVSGVFMRIKQYQKQATNQTLSFRLDTVS